MVQRFLLFIFISSSGYLLFAQKVYQSELTDAMLSKIEGAPGEGIKKMQAINLIMALDGTVATRPQKPTLGQLKTCMNKGIKPFQGLPVSKIQDNKVTLDESQARFLAVKSAKLIDSSHLEVIATCDGKQLTFPLEIKADVAAHEVVKKLKALAGLESDIEFENPPTEMEIYEIKTLPTVAIVALKDSEKPVSIIINVPCEIDGTTNLNCFKHFPLTRTKAKRKKQAAKRKTQKGKKKNKKKTARNTSGNTTPNRQSATKK